MRMNAVETSRDYGTKNHHGLMITERPHVQMQMGEQEEGNAEPIASSMRKWAPSSSSDVMMRNPAASVHTESEVTGTSEPEGLHEIPAGHVAGAISSDGVVRQSPAPADRSRVVLPGVWSDPVEHDAAMGLIEDALAARYQNLDATTVMATVANEAFHELLMNWISFAKEHELPLVVGALDDSILQRCKDSGVPAVSLQHAGFETSLISLSEHAVKHKDFRSSQKGFQNYGVRKLAFLLTLLEMGYDVSLSDTDVVWTKRCGILEPKIIQTGDKRAVSLPFSPTRL